MYTVFKYQNFVVIKLGENMCLKISRQDYKYSKEEDDILTTVRPEKVDKSKRRKYIEWRRKDVFGDTYFYFHINLGYPLVIFTSFIKKLRYLINYTECNIFVKNGKFTCLVLIKKIKRFQFYSHPYFILSD